MPRIPSYNGPQVNNEPILAPHLPTDAPLDAFGGGQTAANAFNAAANLSGRVEDVATQEAKKQYYDGVNQQAMEMANQITKEEIRLKSSFANLSGPDALKATSTVGGDLQKYYQGLEKSIQNDDVRQIVNKHFLSSQNSLDAYAQHAASVKMQQWDEEQFTSEGKTLLDSVSVDPSPANVATAVVGRKRAIELFGQRNGKSPEWIAATQADQASHITLAGLNTLASSGQDLAAKDYFERNKADLVGADLAHANRLVEDTSYRGLAQREVMRIVDGQRSEKETFAEVDKIEDPKLQDMVRERVRQRWGDIKRVNEDAQRADLVEAANIVEGNPDLDAIPVDLFNRLPLTARRSLQERANQIKRGENPPALSDRYFDLLRKSAEDPQAFTKMSMATERSRLAPTEVKELAELQAKIIKGDDAAARKLHGFLSMQEDAKLTLRSMGITDEEDVANFMRALNRDYMTWKANPKNKGQEPNEDEAQELINKLVKPERVWYKLWLGTSPKLQISKYDDIPESERSAIEKTLKEAGEAPTRGRVIDLYLKAHP